MRKKGKDWKVGSTITFTKAQLAFIDGQVSLGKAKSRSEYIRQLLEPLMEGR